MQHNGGVWMCSFELFTTPLKVAKLTQSFKADVIVTKVSTAHFVVYHNWLVRLQTEDLQQFVIQSSSLLNLSSRMYQPFTNLDLANRNFAGRRVKTTLD